MKVKDKKKDKSKKGKKEKKVSYMKRETNPKKCAKMGGTCSCSLAEMGKYC